MNRRHFLGQGGLLLSSSLIRRVKPLVQGTEYRQDSALHAARGVLSRTIGHRADTFDLFIESEPTGTPSFAYAARNGRVEVRGTNAVALCRGAYTYLREHCHVMVTWSGAHLELPARFTDAATTRVHSPFEQVQYLNPCTFGYSAAWWSWERWEKELDWMALHGITMSLALEGQEAIWQRVWLSMGVTAYELERHFTGPAQLPWHRMGNIDGFDGPLRQDWIDGHCLLQHKILGRMHELGMVPIVPGFSGFVPQGLKRVHPDLRAFTEMWHSNQVPHLDKTFILDPRDAALYRAIGGRFIQSYKQEYGPASHFLVDTFNELSIPVRADKRYEDLARFATTVYEGIQAGDPDGMWVMQGWLFRDNPGFWDDRSIAAFLSGVPDDRMIILDYSNDANGYDSNAAAHPLKDNVWQRAGGFHGKRWINGMIHTFGGNNNVKGNLALYAAQQAAVRQDSGHGRLMGWSLNPEGIENNEVAYELLTDLGWHADPIHLDQWIERYCLARYGAYPASLKAAWQLLLESAYSHGTWSTRQAWQCRPSLEPAAMDVDAGPVFQRATEAFLACAPDFTGSTYFRNDLIEFVVQAAGGSVDEHLKRACGAHKRNDAAERDHLFGQAFQILRLMDGLLHVREDRRLERWVASARAWGATPDVQTIYDISARRLITYWGWPDLNDYGSRVWSGLTRDYYLARWREFARALRAGETPYFDEWEESWLSTPYQPSAPMLVHNVPQSAAQLLALCKTPS